MKRKVVGIDEVKQAETQAQIIDEYGRLSDQIDPLEKRRSQLEKVMKGWYPDLDPALSHTLCGKEYALTISAAGRKTEIVSIAKLFKRLGQKVFVESCSFTLEAFRRLIPEPEHADYLRTDEHGGSRRLEIAKKFRLVA